MERRYPGPHRPELLSPPGTKDVGSPTPSDFEPAASLKLEPLESKMLNEEKKSKSLVKLTSPLNPLQEKPKQLDLQQKQKLLEENPDSHTLKPSDPTPPRADQRWSCEFGGCQTQNR